MRRFWMVHREVSIRKRKWGGGWKVDSEVDSCMDSEGTQHAGVKSFQGKKIVHKIFSANMALELFRTGMSNFQF